MSSEALERAEALLAVEPGSNVKSAAWWFAAARDMAREVARLETRLSVAHAYIPSRDFADYEGDARAALVEEPAAAPQLGDAAKRAITEHGAALEALAAADEPATGENDQWCGDDRPHDPHPWSDVFCTGVPPFARAAADEPGETPA